MNATTLTTIISLIIAAVATVFLPMYLNRNKGKQSSTAVSYTDSRQVAQMFKEERDRLQLRLDTMQADYERRMSALRDENARAVAEVERQWRVVHDQDQKQIVQLRDELLQIYHRMHNPNIGHLDQS
jgi:uncharacterized protein YoxC